MRHLVDNTMKNASKYFRVWLITAKISLSRVLATRTASFLFLMGKIIRFSLFIYFLSVVSSGIGDSIGYSGRQLFVFYLVFNFFESMGQVFFRGIYWFRQQVVSGEFDFRLTKPLSPLFQILTRDTDMLDIPILVITFIALIPELMRGGAVVVVPLLIATIASILLTIAVYTAVAAFGIITTEVDHLIWVFRDVSQMVRFPADMYGGVAKTILTYLLPVGIIYTLPAQTLMGLTSIKGALEGLVVACIFVVASMLYWRFALTRYTSGGS